MHVIVLVTILQGQITGPTFAVGKPLMCFFLVIQVIGRSYKNQKNLLQKKQQTKYSRVKKPIKKVVQQPRAVKPAEKSRVTKPSEKPRTEDAEQTEHQVEKRRLMEVKRKQAEERRQARAKLL